MRPFFQASYAFALGSAAASAWGLANFAPRAESGEGLGRRAPGPTSGWAR